MVSFRMKPLFLAYLIFFTVSLHSQNNNSSLIGRSTGPLPFLEFGLGDDRLGGAKMTYLDSNVLLRVVDSVKDDYRVKLSTNHFAYLPKINFRRDSVQPKPYYLTSSFKVFGDDKYDYVTVSMEEKLPYRSIQQIDPSKILVEVYGVTTNTNWITQLKTAKEIKNVYYDHPEDDVFRIHIELKHKQHWGYLISYDSLNRLSIRIKRQPGKLNIKNLRVAIDAGHGGANTGASGIKSKVLEKEYTLMIAKELEKYLRSKNVKVFMTRTDDTDITMIDRTLLLRKEDPDILISIHLNSSGKPEIKGASTYYRYIGFRTLSTAILDRMLELKLDNFGNIGAFNFALSGPTEYPNCLVEVAFLSNEEDERKILSKKFHREVAKKIYLGINDWIKDID